MTTSEDDIDRMEAAILAAMADDDAPAWSTPTTCPASAWRP